MTISPYQRRASNPSPKAPEKPKTNPKNKTTTPEEARGQIAVEASTEAVSLGLALYGAVAELALATGHEPEKFARLATRALYLAADASALSVELGRVVEKIPADVRAEYAAALRGMFDRAKDHFESEAPSPPQPEPYAPEFPVPGPDAGTLP